MFRIDNDGPDQYVSSANASIVPVSDESIRPPTFEETKAHDSTVTQAPASAFTLEPIDGHAVVLPCGHFDELEEYQEWARQHAGVCTCLSCRASVSAAQLTTLPKVNLSGYANLNKLQKKLNNISKKQKTQKEN